LSQGGGREASRCAEEGVELGNRKSEEEARKMEGKEKPRRR